MGDKFKELLKYIAQNMWTESQFRYAHPKTHVEISGLLDKIAELREIEEEANGEEFNQICDQLGI